MKKSMKKLISLLCVAAVSVNIAACGAGKGVDPNNPDNPVDPDVPVVPAPDEPVDESKAQLYISNFNGGVGTDWLYVAKARFEEQYKDKVFVEGTKGVQIWIETHKNSGVATAEKMAMERNEIYFLESTNYYDMAYSGKLLDITDMVTADLTAYGESESIEDKMDQAYVDYFKTPDEKYFALPHYRSIYSMTYDMDVFDDNDLYFDQAGELTKKSTDSDKSKGPDGKAGTYDDGLPATYDEMWTLCETMVQRGVDPFVWSGQYGFYVTCFLASLKADFEGDEAKLNYTFDGTATKLVDTIDANGKITYKPATKITKANGYEMYNSAGTYHALSFINKIIEKQWYASVSFNGAQGHIDAQNSFLVSKYSSKLNPIGMLIEGCWWPHESAGNFQSLVSQFGSSASLKNRRLAMMPLPKATADLVGTQTTSIDVSQSVACISGYIAENKKELAKTFMQFLHTDASLIEFLQVTNMTRGFNYEVPETVYNKLNTFAQSTVNTVLNSKVHVPGCSDNFFVQNFSTFDYQKAFETNHGAHPHIAMNGGKTLEQIWSAARTKHNQTTWNKLIGA